MNLSEYQVQALLQSLIKAELNNAKLIHGLQQAGLVLDHFHTDLLPSILFLLGHASPFVPDTLYETCFHEIERITDLPLSDFHVQLPTLAQEMAERLKNQKESLLP